MKSKKSKIIFGVWLLGLVTSIFWNSFVEPENRIPFLPVVDISINGSELPPLRPDGEIIGSSQIRRELIPLVGTAANTMFADRDYQAVNHTDVLRMIRWMQDFYFNTPTLRYFPESYDCDNFARTFVVFSDLAGIPNFDWTGQIAFFRIYVEQRHAWGSVPAGGGHALVIFRSDRGWFAYEPQSGAIQTLSKYPNRNFVFQVLTD